jgi:hypothetical protein
MSELEKTSREKHDALVLAQIIVQRLSGSLKDAEALSAPLGLEIWGANRPYDKGQKIRHGERLPGIPQLYGVMRDVATSQAHQPPSGEGMLAVYRPINPEHAGTPEDPIPYVYGMDCTSGRYYSYEGATYLCKGDMLPAVWLPDSGTWQWERVGEAE